ncbi:CHAT domain-containing protein [Nonomuraea sp. NPDC050691]|uniref:CHAT domain-containing protein n=1 Tax=Nonomuraea sp. NPDC050691 TaxID=3155661 RepID=UPI0033E8450F
MPGPGGPVPGRTRHAGRVVQSDALGPARTGPVMEALASADVLHLAAHGVFHARSPLLSSITLDDGPLMAYDLLRLPRSPRLVVLSACDSGMARVPAEGAPLGLAGAFLARGTACVVAGMVPVRDDDALAVMTLFHELLARGESPASALAAASAKTEVPGFACFGAGHRRLTPPA